MARAHCRPVRGSRRLAGARERRPACAQLQAHASRRNLSARRLPHARYPCLHAGLKSSSGSHSTRRVRADPAARPADLKTREGLARVRATRLESAVT